MVLYFLEYILPSMALLGLFDDSERVRAQLIYDALHQILGGFAV
jgi:hypothetical protein